MPGMLPRLLVASRKIFFTSPASTRGSGPFRDTRASVAYTFVKAPGTPTLISRSLRWLCFSASLMDRRIFSSSSPGLFHPSSR